MKSILIKQALQLAKIFTPPIICFLIVYFGDGYNHFEFIIIIPFSLSIVLFNINKKKYNFNLTIFLSLILSAASFCASLLVFFGLGYPLEYFFDIFDLKENLNEIFLRFFGILVFSIFSPILIFFWFKKLFEVPKNRISRFICYFTYLLQAILILTLEIKSSLVIALWQFVMVLALQLILYQGELVALFKSK